MKSAFVDTGAWYALVDRKDPDHESVTEAFQDWKGRLVTSNYVLDEAITLMRYRLGWDVARRVGDSLWQESVAKIIRLNIGDERSAWEIFCRYNDQSFSFTDCASFALMERLKIDIALAIDSDFRAYGLRCLPDSVKPIGHVPR